MTHFKNKPVKNKPGFLSFEALIAVTLVGLFIVPLIAMQVSMRSRIIQNSHSFQRLLFMTHLLHQARHEQKDKPQSFNLTATETDPATHLTYTLSSVSPQSSLQVMPGMLQEKIQATNPNRKTENPETCISFIYRPPQEKEQAP